MIQEDQNHMCSYGNGGGESGSSIIKSSSKKLKQTKVPQRGLGVAQLEKIRIEQQQQQRNDSKISPPPPPLSPPPPPPPPPPSRPLMPSNFPLSGPLVRAHSLPNVDNFHVGSIHSVLNPPAAGGGFSSNGWPSIPTNGSVNLPKLWHHELYNDHKGQNSSLLQDLSLPYETCPIIPSPNGHPKAHQYYHHHPHQSSFSLVNNVSLSNGTSSSSSLSSSSTFVPKYSMEPPSNQNYFNNYLPFWQDDPKVMLGMKRSCPSMLEDPPIPLFRNTLPLNGIEESTSSQNGTMHNLDPPIFRDFASCQSATHEPTTSLWKRSSKSQIGNSNEELLANVPTTRGIINSSFPNSISKHSSMNLTSNDKEVCNFKALPHHASNDDGLMNARNGSSSQEPKCINLFPSTKLRTTSETTTTTQTTQNGCNYEVSENIDLNLRL